MDRNGKKPKATRDATHPERSDTKTQARDAAGRMEADARVQRERSSGSGAANAQPKGGRKGHRG